MVLNTGTTAGESHISSTPGLALAENTNQSNQHQHQHQQQEQALPQPIDTDSDNSNSNAAMSASCNAMRATAAIPSTVTAASTPMDDHSSSPDVQKPKRKRRRVPVSCNVCRTRKLKCDKEIPCGSCKKLRLESHCHFETAESYLENLSAAKQESSIGGGGSTGAAPTPHHHQLHAAYPPQHTPEPVDEPQHVNRLFKGKLLTFNQINKTIGPGSDYNLPDKQIFCEFDRAVKLTNMDTISKMSIPDASRTSKQFPTPLPEILDRSVDMIKWKKVLHYFPPIEVCRFLAKRFMEVYGPLFCEYCDEYISHDIDEAREIHLRYLLTCRQQSAAASSGGAQHNEPVYKLRMPELHTVCLVMLVIHMARVTLPPDWTTKQIDGVDEDIYLGDGLRQMVWAAVNATNLEEENSLQFTQILYFLSIYHNFLVLESDEFGGYLDGKVVSMLVQSAQINSLHRDPTSFSQLNEKDVEIRRKMWRQVVFIDSLYAAHLSRYPQINLERNFFGTYTDLSSPYHQRIDEFCLITRELVNKVLVNSSDMVPKSVLTSIEQRLVDLAADVQQTKSMQSSQRLFVKMLAKQLKLKFDQVCASTNNHETVRSAIATLLIEHEMRTMSTSFVLSNLALRYAGPAWYLLAYSLLTPEEIEKHCLPVSERSIGTSSELTAGTLDQVVRVLLDSYHSLSVNATKSFFCWRQHLLMYSVLVCLKSMLKSDRASSGLQFKECVPPRESKWVDWIVTDMEREWSYV